MKRFVSVILALALLFVPVCAFAESYEISYGVLKQFDSLALLPNDSAAQAIYKALLEFKDSVYLGSYGLTPEEAQAAFQAVKNTAADLFYVGTKYQASQRNDGTVGTMYFKNSKVNVYLYDQNVCAQMSAELNKRLNAIAAQAQSTWTDFEKALFVHDYLCANFRYDTSVFTDPTKGSTTFTTLSCRARAFARPIP